MKKYTYSLLASLVCAFQGAYAVETFYTDKNAGDIPFPLVENADYEIYYNGTAGGSARLGGTTTMKTQHTLSSITFKASDGTESTSSPSNWVALVNWVFDTKDVASGEKTVLKNETDTSFQLQWGKITIQNTSTDSTSTALLDFGNKERWFIKGNNTDQFPVVDIKTNTRIVTSVEKYGLDINTNATFNVLNNSTLTLDTDARTANKYAGVSGGDVKFYIEEGSTVVIGSGKTFSVEVDSVLTNNGTIKGQGSNLTIINGQNIAMDGVIDLTQYKDDDAKITRSTLTIGNGTKITANNKFYADNIIIDGAESALYVADFNRTNGATELTNGATIIANGTMTTGQGQTIKVQSGSQMIVNACSTNASNSLNNYAIENANSLLHIKSGAISNRSGYVKDGGILQIDGTYKIANNGNRTDYNHAAATKITVATGGKIKTNEIILVTAKLDLQTVNAITNANGDAINLTTDTASKGSLLAMSASQTFDTITANTTNLEVEITGDAVLTASFASENGGKIFINGFAEDRVFVANADQITDVNSIFFAYATAGDASTQISQLYINNGWLSAIAPAVPEPAEWAMIFGSIALGLAIYRRRK
ncbi:MAG: hypothetical protein J6K91_00050 [Opitutales bacterium]|nr:hypothetical protein [Opitutales bacterium]